MAPLATINGNNLQASYEGGDGNDLTLTGGAVTENPSHK
jgi:hypothetical protein